MNWKILTATIILSVLLVGCAADIEPIEPADDSKATAEGAKTVIDANNQFALEFYSKINGDENIFFSPYSISAALAMTYEGARGKTADEIQSVFHFPGDDNIRRPSFARIYNQINKQDKKYKLNTANALWAQEDYAFLPEYLGLVEQYYGGKTTNLDFVTKTEESRQIINNWVEEQTNNKIKDLIPAGALDSMTRLVLTNAIYFKGTWVLKFNRRHTGEADFRISPGRTVKVPMMSLTGEKARFNYTFIPEEGLQVLEMPYAGEELSMLVLLPKEGGLAALEESLTVERLNELRGSLREMKIDVYMPKFKFETKYFMSKVLAEMGMPTAFSMAADFSGMDGTDMLFISKVIHQAFVEVNEEGTEAAAATAVVMTLKSAMPTVFRADHPFIFIIQERETGNILFLGKVVDPSQA
ncbi:serpin family protein [Candidatus Woesearchaeota archaeon]|nr:serpin family protein [Candidatus Woesearchaeota archaeon]